jgi:hypothetical protein
VATGTTSASLIMAMSTAVSLFAYALVVFTVPWGEINRAS